MKNKVTQGINQILNTRIKSMYTPFFTTMFKLRKVPDANSVAQQATLDTLRNFGL